jgi:hypothetical protein
VAGVIIPHPGFGSNQFVRRPSQEKPWHPAILSQNPPRERASLQPLPPLADSCLGVPGPRHARRLLAGPSLPVRGLRR